VLVELFFPADDVTGEMLLGISSIAVSWIAGAGKNGVLGSI
jgi:hypothetical protein